ncbi:MAG: hypothetical protein IMW89_07090 [Ktedonobacteraceae bacterium]|nr:hypothetical protein [Ktedonobacteraceae bacterium]
MPYQTPQPYESGKANKEEANKGNKAKVAEEKGYDERKQRESKQRNRRHDAGFHNDGRGARSSISTHAHSHTCSGHGGGHTFSVAGICSRRVVVLVERCRHVAAFTHLS